MIQTQTIAYRFNDIYLDVVNRQLWRGNALLSLNSKYFDVLVLLISHCGQLIEKRRIFDEIWDGVFVTDSALTQCIKSIRKLLDDDATHPRYIRTVPKHGYVFIGEAVEIHQEQVTAPQVQTEEATGSRPYKFLDYYTQNDSPLFFGREQEIDAICSQILTHRSYILYGRSGVGKSSILRAGLMPRLRAEGHLVFALRSFTEPLHQMRSILSLELGLGADDTDMPATLDALVRHLYNQDTERAVIVLLDQFEEFFLLLDEDQRQPFIDAVGTLLADEYSPIRFIFVLREDILAEMNQFKPTLPEIFHHEYRLKRLDRVQASLAITGPALAVGCTYEPKLVEILLDDLSEQDGVDPPHLQIVCDTLYDARDEKGTITTYAYERFGGASHILAEYLTRVLRRFTSSDLTAVQDILLGLISVDGQRLVLRTAELESRLARSTIQSTTPPSNLIEELVAARVVRRRSQEGESWLELAHECLIPEVSRWLTANVYEVKQARSLLERSVENYRAHRLILDSDSLDLLLPFLDQLGLAGEEADLLTLSLLRRGSDVPDWLARLAPSASDIILDATQEEDTAVRLSAVVSSRPVRGSQLNARLRTLALWDEDLGVRKAASIELADWFGSAVEAVIARAADEKRVGRIRRAISLAIVREHNNRLVQLPHLSFAVSFMVMLGLILVRLRRDGMSIIRQGVGGTGGGAMSGLFGGLLLGIGLALARHPVGFEVTSAIFLLSCLGMFVGAFGGAAVSFGMIAADEIAYRHSRWWRVAGGALGGAFIGACVHLFSTDALNMIFGRNLTGLAGGLEGGLIGAGVVMGPVLVNRFFPDNSSWHHILHILGGALGGMCAGAVLSLIGGTLVCSSLEIVRQSFADSQIRLEPLFLFFGEGHFGMTTKIALGALEGFLFGGGVMTGIKVFAQPDERKAVTGDG
ncbi:MAG: winged helix-turn-helix domain-containing protein [Gemmatimonadota bacterium]|nr:winged helix-turn-helix domain-containing protein [Gemmatimonadota bacterium]